MWRSWNTLSWAFKLRSCSVYWASAFPMLWHAWYPASIQVRGPGLLVTQHYLVLTAWSDQGVHSYTELSGKVPRADLRGLFHLQLMHYPERHFFPLFFMQLYQMQRRLCKSSWDFLANLREHIGQYLSGNQQTWLPTQEHISVRWRVSQCPSLWNHSLPPWCAVAVRLRDSRGCLCVFIQWLYNWILSLGHNPHSLAGRKKTTKLWRPVRTCWVLAWSCVWGKTDGRYSLIPFHSSLKNRT